jgi:hypothetical protein
MKYDINNDLSKLNEWTKLWLVDFNPKKTKALVISTSAVPHTSDTIGLQFFLSRLYAKPYQMPLIYHKIQ